MATSRSPSAYFPHVDGLRAIAVLAVLIYHLDASWLPGGFAGVDIFFVISGFIVSASVGAQRDARLPSFLALFYARRLQRIGPALVVCLLATALASALLVPAVWLSHAAPMTGIYAFFGLSNFILARTQNDYFSPISDFNPYTHTWSLGVEEQFYFVFPLLFVAWIGRHRRPRLSLALFGLAFVLSLAWAARLAQVDPTAGYYMITSRLWQLAAGVLLYQGMVLAGRRFDTAVQTSARMSSGLAVAGLAALAYALVTSKSETFPFPGALIVVAGAVLVLGALHGKPASHWLVAAIANRPMLFIGRISYSLYLWHWPVFVLFRWTVGLDLPAMKAAAVALSFALAVASYRWVETPVRHWSALRRMPRIAVVCVGVAVLAASAGLANTINRHQPAISIHALAKAPLDWYPYGQADSATQPGCRVQTDRHGLTLGTRIEFHPQGCSPEPQAPRVLAIGDSHALGYEAMFKAYAMQTGADVVLYANGGCPFLSMQPWIEDTPHCRDHARVALEDMVARAGPDDVIFLPSLRLPRLADQWMQFPQAQFDEVVFSRGFAELRDAAVDPAIDVVRRLRASGAAVVFEAPKPIFRSPPLRCAHAYNATNAICADGLSMDRQQLLVWREPVVSALGRVIESTPGVSLWDPFPVLCPDGEQCHAMREGRPLFMDSDHVSGYGNVFLLPSFTAFVTAAGARSREPGAPAP